MKDKHLYDHYFEDSDLDDEIMPEPPSFKAVAIGFAISVAVIYGALRLWNLFQRS